jgi:hypothetical protein
VPGTQNHGNKQIAISQVIVALYEDGQLFRHKGDLADATFREIDSKNRGKFQACMRLVQAVWTEEQKTKLATNPSKTKQMPKMSFLKLLMTLKGLAFGKSRNLKARALILDIYGHL